MTRVIEPALERLDFLPTPLTDGESRVLEFFDRHLPEGWEIYIQPHLNGLQPDFVVLHPEIGIGVFEVKDWDFGALRYFAKEKQLWAKDRSGNIFSRERDNPVRKLRSYKQAIMDLYCAGLTKGAGFGVIAAGVIFTKVRRSEALKLCRRLRTDDEDKYSRRYPVAGEDTLKGGYLNTLFPLVYDNSSPVISEEAVKVFRGWLREPYSAREQYESISLDNDQKRGSDGRTESGFRRVRGPAGSGKTEVVARRAALLAMQNKRVLVTCFNITMMNYLRDAVARHIRAECGLDEQLRFRAMRKFEVMYVHKWVSDCWELLQGEGKSRLVEDTGPKNRSYFAEEHEVCKNCGVELQMSSSRMTFCEECQSGIWAIKLRDVYAAYKREASDLPMYDAVVADEGQDLSLDWWRCLSSAVHGGGECLLAVDKTQNVYGRAKAWTDEAMAGSGFRGAWFNLGSSYRLPSRLLPIIKDYAGQFLQNEDVDIPKDMTSDSMITDSCKLRWIQLSPGARDGSVICADEMDLQMRELPSDMANADCVILAQSNSMGKRIVTEFQRRNLNVLELFDTDQRESRRKKLRFYKGAPKVKISTIHSYKGWESRQLVIWLWSLDTTEQKCLFYVAMTRLLGHINGCSLTVVCEEPGLREFGLNWFDDFHET